MRSILQTAAIAATSILGYPTGPATADLLAGARAPIEMQTTGSVRRTPALPPGGRWVGVPHNPNGCQGYVRNGENVIVSVFVINGERVSFRRGTTCQWNNTHGSSGVRFIDIRRRRS